MSHLAGEWFKRAAGIEITAVNYKGELSAVDHRAIGNQISMVIADAGACHAQHDERQDSRARGYERETLSFTPELPTFAEEGLKGFEAVIGGAFSFPRACRADHQQGQRRCGESPRDVRRAEGEARRLRGRSGFQHTGRVRQYMDAERAKWGKLSRKPISGWIDQSGLNRSASLSRFSNTISHTPWPSLSPRCLEFRERSIVGARCVILGDIGQTRFSA